MTDRSLARSPMPGGIRREAIIVLDDDPAIAFRSAGIDEFRSQLEATGAFRSVETRALAIDHDDRIALARGPDDPAGLGAGPHGPRAIFLVTLGRSPGWRRGWIPGLLAGWARDGVVAVVHLLPQQHWHDLGLRVTEVVWTPGARFTPTAATPWRSRRCSRRSAPSNRCTSPRC